jgi:hypothetical protein
MSDDLGNGWDLQEVLAERKQPTKTVAVFLNEVASYGKAELLVIHAKTTDAEALKIIDDELSNLEADLEASKYTIHITAVPSRMREDIASKAMHAHPIKSNFMGQDDSANALERQKYENELVWAAQVFRVDNPQGQSKTSWTFEEMKQFAESLPTAAQRAVDAAIRELTVAAEKFTVESKTSDF